MKMLLELGPIVVFFVANSRWGILWGTGLFMAATLIALAALGFHGILSAPQVLQAINPLLAAQFEPLA